MEMLLETLAARGHVSLPLLLAVAAAAVGSHVAGYELGRRYGGKAVFLGRWTDGTRALVPLFVAACRLPYCTFTLYNVLGGAAWAAVFVVLGSAAGTSLPAVERALGQFSWWVTAVLVVPLALRVGAAASRALDPRGAREGEVTCRATTGGSSRP